MGKTILAKELKAGDRFKYHQYSRDEYVFVKSTIKFRAPTNDYALVVNTETEECVMDLRASVWLL